MWLLVVFVFLPGAQSGARRRAGGEAQGGFDLSAPLPHFTVSCILFNRGFPVFSFG